MRANTVLLCLQRGAVGMERRQARRAGTLIVGAGIVLAAVGNLTGNLMSTAVPSAWADRALPILALVALAGCVAALFLGKVQRFASENDPQRRSRVRRFATALLIVLAELLAATLGVASNVAAGHLPTSLTPFAVPLFFGMTAVVVML